MKQAPPLFAGLLAAIILFAAEWVSQSSCTANYRPEAPSGMRSRFSSRSTLFAWVSNLSHPHPRGECLMNNRKSVDLKKVPYLESSLQPTLVAG
jgi:hypothetical protein